MGSTIKNIVISARPHYWVKNLLVFSVLIFSANILNLSLLLPVLFAFVIYVFISGSIYILNDVIDISLDKQNPQKKNRPIARGVLSKKIALTTSIMTAGIFTALAFYLNIYLGIIIVSYIILNILYSFFIKKVPILDVFLLSIGFFLRVLAGGVVINLMPSYWLILCVFFISLFFGFSKRYYEVVSLNDSANKYKNKQFLQVSIYIFATISIIIYTLYAISARTVEIYGDMRLLISLPFVLFGIIRYIYMNIFTDRVMDPVTLLYKDKFSAVNLVLWFICIIYLIYFY